uniref:Maestro heat-like repeat-containing protein family member 1 n=3 Tax=Hirondellea gigas TaxID=1518452 RepID=A0A6A7G7W7_9CRUS
MAPPAEFNEKGVVWALVCGIGDVCADVRVAAQSSLCMLGAQQPTPVLRVLLHTCMQQPSPAPGVLATLMSISQKVMIDCASNFNKRKESLEISDDVFDDPENNAYRNTPDINAVTATPQAVNATDNCSNAAAANGVRLSPLDCHILDDWVKEAIHQLTRTGANNTVRVAADSLLVTIAVRHGYFNEVCDALVDMLSSSSVKDVAWQSAVETVGNVCSGQPSLAIFKLATLLKSMQDGASKANSDQVKSIIAATVAKLAQTVAEVVAEKDNKLANSRETTLQPVSGVREDASEGAQEKVEERLDDSNVDGGDAATTEPISEPIVIADDTEPVTENNDTERHLFDDDVMEGMNLEQELNQAAMKVEDKAVLENNVLLSARLPDSPPSSRQDGNKATQERGSITGSDSTPEDGLTLDFHIDDLPHDPNTVSDVSVEPTNKPEDVCLSSYTSQCDLIVDVLVNQWLKSSNSDLRNETIAAIGHICALLSREKLETISPTVVSSIITFYKKISLPYNLTCTLAQLLAAVVSQEATHCLKLHLDTLMGSVLTQASAIPSYSEPNSVSNHSEALRCCHLLTIAFPAQMGTQLLNRLENASHVQRIAALVVTKHLIGCKALSDDIISGIVRLLTPVLHDSNTRVIRSVAQLILELCHQGHLDQTSASPLLTYLVKHSAGAGTNLLNNGTTNSGGNGLTLMAEETVGDTCSRALYLLTTTVPCSHPLLWPRLLTFLVNPDYESSLPTVLPCIVHLVTQPHHSPDVLPLLPLLPSLPYCVSTQQLLTRLLGMCADPASHPFLGGCALNVLAHLGGHMSSSLLDLEWKEQVEQLRRTCVSLASTEQDSTSLQIWQDTVREFLGLTLAAIADNSFTNSLVSAMLSEVTCDSESERRLFLLSCLGVALKHSEDTRLITDTLNTVLHLTNHRNPLEQASLAVCVGSCGAGHTQLVLALIATWLKEADPKKIHSFMAMIKSDSGESSAFLRGSVVVCLGQLCSLAPHHQLLAHVDGPIMLHLLNVINNNKHPMVSAAVVECISCVCRALTAVPGGFVLRQRPLLITHLVHCCDPPNSAQLPNIIAALRDLVLLTPALEVEERTILLQAALNSTHTILTTPPSTTSSSSQPPPPTSLHHRGSISSNIHHRSSSGISSHRSSISHTASSTLKSLASAASHSSLSTPRHSIASFTGAALPGLTSLTGGNKQQASTVKTEDSSPSSGFHNTVVPVEADALTGDAGKAFAQLNLLLRTIVQRDPTPAPLDDITTLLQAWLLHPNTTVRSAAITLLLHTLHTYHTHLSFPPLVAVNFHQTSQLVGALVPRLGDSCAGVRCGGVGCVVAVLRIAARYNAHQPSQIEEALQPLTDVQKEIGNISGEEHEALLRTVAQVLCRELSGVQLRSLVFATAGGLQDRQAGGRLAVAVIVAEVLLQRGHTLHYCCKQLLDHVYGRLEKVSEPHTRTVLVDGLTNLASPHLPLLADTLLAYPIPPHRGVCETWRAVGRKAALVCGAVTHLQQVLERTHAYTLQRTHTGHNVKVAAIQPLAALLCLTELLRNLQTPAPNQQHQQGTTASGTPGPMNGQDNTDGSTGCTTPSSLATTATVGRDDSRPTSPTPPPHPHAQAREAVINLIPGVLATLLPRYGCYVGVLPPLHHISSPPTGGGEGPDTAPQKTMSSFVPNPGATNIVPARVLIECLGNVWGVLGCVSLRDCLLQEAADLTHIHTLDTLTHTLTNTATLLVSTAPQQLSALVSSLSGPHADRGERAAIAALYSQLVHESCGGQLDVLARVTSVLLMLVQDICPDVRRLALRGLAHYAHLHNSKCYFPAWFGVDDRLHEIVGALVGGTDQRENSMASIDADTDTPGYYSGSAGYGHEGGGVSNSVGGASESGSIASSKVGGSSPQHVTNISSGSRNASHSAVVLLGPEEKVCVEALRGLAALLPQLPAETVLPHTPLLLIRARLFAEKKSGEMREASFGVVRGLSSVVGATQEFQEQLPQHLLAAIIHLADSHTPTVVLCKSALLSLSHHVSSPALQQLLQARLSPAASLDYKNFLAALAPLLVSWLGEQLSLIMAAASSYYHSRQPELRAAAAHFTAEVVRWGGGEGAAGVAAGLVHLMKDPEAHVRTAAATASHLLSQHTHVL